MTSGDQSPLAIGISRGAEGAVCRSIIVRPDIGCASMETLQPLKAYTEGSAAVWARQAWLAGVAFGAAMAILTPWIAPGEGRTRATTVAALVAFAGGGSLCGFTWSRWMMRSMRRMTERLYDGSPPFAVDAPAGAYRYRLPASLRTSDRFAIGGVLFLGRGAMVFVPHRLNLSSHRQPINVLIEGEVGVEAIPQRSTAIRRVLFGDLPALVRVSCNGQSWLFLVPWPEDTAQKIHDVIAGS